MLASVALVLALSLPGELVNINLSVPPSLVTVNVQDSSGLLLRSYPVRQAGYRSRILFRLVGDPYSPSAPRHLYVYRVCGAAVDVRDIPFTEAAVTELVEDQMRCRG